MLESSVGTDMEPLIDEPHWLVEPSCDEKGVYFDLFLTSDGFQTGLFLQTYFWAGQASCVGGCGGSMVMKLLLLYKYMFHERNGSKPEGSILLKKSSR